MHRPKRRKPISDFGWKVLVRLRELRWTQSDLADALRTSRQNVSQAIRSRHPWLETVRLYAEALQVAPSRLDPSFPARVRDMRAAAGLPTTRGEE